MEDGLDVAPIDRRIEPQDLKHNPYRHKTPKIRWHEWIQIALACMIGLPIIRLILTIIILFFIVGNYLLFSCCLLIPEKEEGGSWLRLLTTWLGYLGCRAILFVWGFYYIPRTYKNGCTGPICFSGATMDLRASVLIANHSSAITDFIILLAFHLPAFVAMRPVRGYPVLGRLAQGIGCLFVERDKKGGVSKQIKDRIQAYTPGCFTPRLAIFPEGTVTGAHSLSKFRTGAFLAGSPVQPICIHYSNSNYGCVDISTMALGGHPSDLNIFLRMLCSFCNFVSLTYLPIYTPSEEEKKNPTLYAQGVRKVMADELGYECSDHTYEDLAVQGAVGVDYFEKNIAHKISGKQMQVIGRLGLRDLRRLVRAYKILEEEEAARMVPKEISDASGVKSPVSVGELSEGTSRRARGSEGVDRIAFRAFSAALSNCYGKKVDEVFDFLARDPAEQDWKGVMKTKAGRGFKMDIIAVVLGLGLLQHTVPVSIKDDIKEPSIDLDTKNMGSIEELVVKAKTTPALVSLADAALKKRLPLTLGSPVDANSQTTDNLQINEDLRAVLESARLLEKRETSPRTPAADEKLPI
ncbi:hypothetical protein AAMO2058_000854800 [Amorphochlora amoebiformis]